MFLCQEVPILLNQHFMYCTKSALKQRNPWTNIVWNSVHGQISQQWSCGWMLRCSRRSLRPYFSFSTTLLSSVTVTPSTKTEEYEPLVIWRVCCGLKDDLTIGINYPYHFWITAKFTGSLQDEYRLLWPSMSLSFCAFDTLMKWTRIALRKGRFLRDYSIVAHHIGR